VKIVDKMLRILFARYRRKLGDSNIGSAHFQANNKLAAYLGFLIVAFEIVLLAIIYVPFVKGSAFDSRGTIISAMTIIYIVVTCLLMRGSSVLVRNPPRLTESETLSEARYAFWFRALSLGSFVLSCVFAFILHRLGFPVIPSR